MTANPISTGWSLVRKNDCSLLKAPVDDRLETLSGQHMMPLGIHNLQQSNWTEKSGQGGLSRLFGEELTGTDIERWNEIGKDFTQILLAAGFTFLGMNSSVYNRMPFVYCFHVQPKTGSSPVYDWEYLFTDEWAEGVEHEVLRQVINFEKNPLRVGVYCGNEVFWNLRKHNLTESQFRKIHFRYVQVVAGAIKKYAPHWLVFSNKYAANSLIEHSWDWMSKTVMVDLWQENIELGVDVICVNYYPANEFYAKQIGPSLASIEFSLESRTGKFIPVMLSETGAQANESVRETSYISPGLWQRYTSKQYPQVSSQVDRGKRMETVIKGIVEAGGLGYSIHAACDHGPEYAKWWKFWKKYNQYSNWGVYDPWQDIVYDEYLEYLTSVHGAAVIQREAQTGLELWRYE
jgi:hypothetical protein